MSQSNRVEVLNILESEHFFNCYPANYQEKDLSTWKEQINFTLPEVQVKKVKNCTIFEDGALFIGNHFLEDSARDPKEQKMLYQGIRFWIKKNIRFKRVMGDPNKQYLTLIDHWSREYYHWIAEALPRLLNASKHIDLTNTTLILSEHYKGSFIAETLKAFPIKEIYYLPAKHIFQAPNLYYSTYAAPIDFHHPILAKELRDHLQTHFLKTMNRTLPYCEKIFISRKKARFRKIRNEDEVRTTLHQKGFLTIYAEDYSLAEQVQLFSRCKYLVSTHGAGLTNIYFLANEARILEFRKERPGIIPKTNQEANFKFYNTYFMMSEMLGHNYWYQLCSSPNENEHYRYADINVDITELKNNIEEMLS